MLPGCRTSAQSDDEPLLRRAKRLIAEAQRIGASSSTGQPYRAELVASLAAELADVYRAMGEECEAIKAQLDAAVRQKAAVTAYGQIAQTLNMNRKRT
ncbi:hypothetical protein [Blastochloris sulfoviridis]|uniref:Uncharacterized protein n=1 Tax=Blastochloris sulfoviridis TaxID=50712 RepID=A0A5M6I2Y3_9HYPH|nr:hypothetical protein [Blastochloris sulfoviridis]KAA5602556.1 hypothetical protein F1193_05175 [Blastochloris sulfoviridis]